MKVAFGQIAAGGSRYVVTETSWFPSEECRLLRVDHVVADLLKTDSDTVELKGEVRVTAEFCCDRCCEPFAAELSADFFYIFKIGVDASLQIAERECSEEDSNTVYLAEPVVDIGEVLREQVVLAAPLRRLCREDCKGLCPRCGGNLASASCTCLPDREDSPFAVLQKLKKH